MVTTNHPSWLPKRSITPVYITIALAVLALIYWVYQAIFGGDERAAREAEEQLSERSRALCAATPPPGVRAIMGDAPGRPNGHAGCIWGTDPKNDLHLRRSMSTLDRHKGSAGPGTSITSSSGKEIWVTDTSLFCVAAFDDRIGHFFELRSVKTSDPECAKVGPAAGELADLIIK